MRNLKRLLFLAAVLGFTLSWSHPTKAMGSDCGFEESDPEGGGFSYCITSWCGSKCQAIDCIYADGSEYHWISGGCSMSQ